MGLFAIPPLAGELRVTSPFGEREDPITGERAGHSGVDLAAPVGTPVFAPGNGRVIKADSTLDESEDAGGLELVVELDNGARVGFAHLSAVYVVPGERINVGDYIADTGNTGRSTGPHLHLTLRRRAGEPRIDPLPHLRGFTVASVLFALAGVTGAAFALWWFFGR
jgi:murein DD-endopeptidase